MSSKISFIMERLLISKLGQSYFKSNKRKLPKIIYLKMDKFDVSQFDVSQFDVFNIEIFYLFFSVADLFKARVHLGHTPRSLTEQMRPFIYGTRFDVCIFDLDETAVLLRQSLNFLAHIAYRQSSSWSHLNRLCHAFRQMKMYLSLFWPLFKFSGIFWGSWGSIENWLKPKTKPH